MIIQREQDEIEVTEIYGGNNAEFKNKKRSKSLDKS